MYRMKHDFFSLKNKVAIVTGGNQGIGKVVAGYLADAGADVVIFDLIDATAVAEEIAEEYGVRTAAFVCNVTDPEAVESEIQAAADKMGTLDLLFNNAGICLHKEALYCTPDDWLKVVNTASMSGTIVNIPQGQASYNSSKAGVAHLTKSLAVEWADKGIRVNSISPGYIRTEMTGTVREDWQEYWISTIPFKRMGTPEELAGAVIYLLSDASTYTSGLDMIIDGCFTIV